MNIDYLIVGLPRCRSSWLANLLTYGKSVCIHEFYSTNLHEKMNLREWFGNEAKIGVCETDPGIDYPEVPTVIIKRPVEEVIESLCNSFFHDEIEDLEPVIELPLHLMEDKLRGLAVRENTLEVNFRDLDKQENIDLICQHIGVQIPNWRTQLLQAYEVQPMNTNIDQPMFKKYVSNS